MTYEHQAYFQTIPIQLSLGEQLFFATRRRTVSSPMISMVEAMDRTKREIEDYLNVNMFL